MEDALTTIRKPCTMQMEKLPDFVFDPNIDAAQRTKLMEHAIIE